MAEWCVCHGLLLCRNTETGTETGIVMMIVETIAEVGHWLLVWSSEDVVSHPQPMTATAGQTTAGPVPPTTADGGPIPGPQTEIIVRGLIPVPQTMTGGPTAEHGLLSVEHSLPCHDHIVPLLYLVTYN